MSLKKHLIFDCDGVIVDSEIVATRISLRLLKPFGYHADELTHAERYAGLLENEILERLRHDEGLDLPADLFHNIVQEIQQHMFEEMQPVPGMKALILALPVPLAVVSNSRVAHVTRCLSMMGIHDAVGERIFSAEHVAKPKPHPDVYLLAVERLGLDPAATLVVEDSLAGVTAAMAAGLEVIGFLGASHISPQHAARLRSAGVQTLAANAAELAQHLNERLIPA
jgi:HAD superfamily hydrolase (TIGR01509 family)